jgi:Stanniocalcin family
MSPTCSDGIVVNHQTQLQLTTIDPSCNPEPHHPIHNRRRSPPHDECMDPRPNTCTFYTECLNRRIPCGSDGYPIGYGLHFCNAFLHSAAPKMSTRGKTWITKTMLCLQQRLVPFGSGERRTTCPNLKSVAFGSHPGCYVSSGLCTLPPTDWVTIVKTVSLKELFGSLDALKETLKTAEGCAEFYTWLIERGVIKVADKVKDGAKSVWHKVTSWF